MCVMQADASLLSSIIMVQDLLIESQRPRSHPVHVVGVVRCPETVKVANYMVKDLSQGTMTAELLQPDELVSGLMAQVHPHLHSFMFLLMNELTYLLTACLLTHLLTHFLLASLLGYLQLYSFAYYSLIATSLRCQEVCATEQSSSASFHTLCLKCRPDTAVPSQALFC